MNEDPTHRDYVGLMVVDSDGRMRTLRETIAADVQPLLRVLADPPSEALAASVQAIRDLIAKAASPIVMAPPVRIDLAALEAPASRTDRAARRRRQREARRANRR